MEYFISDTHLDHANIIRYCDRPFSNVNDMNKAIVRNWNAIVKPDDIVYHLGDFAFHRKNYWLSHLNGQIIFVNGNHDHYKMTAVHSLIFRHKGISFMLLHDPKYITPDWRGWTIHGHQHTKPSINKRAINVSADLTNFTPVSIDKLMEMINRSDGC